MAYLHNVHTVLVCDQNPNHATVLVKKANEDGTSPEAKGYFRVASLNQLDMLHFCSLQCLNLYFTKENSQNG